MTTLKQNCKKLIVTLPANNTTSLNDRIDDIKGLVNRDNLLKAVVAVTTIMNDGTIAHMQLDVDNESDVEKTVGFVAAEVKDASTLYRHITELSNMRVGDDVIELGNLVLDLNTD